MLSYRYSRPVSELKNSISYRTFRLLHYREIRNRIRRKRPDDIGQVILDGFARLTATLININRDPEKGQPVSEEETRVTYGRPKKPREMTLEETEQVLFALLSHPLHRSNNGESGNASS